MPAVEEALQASSGLAPCMRQASQSGQLAGMHQGHIILSNDAHTAAFCPYAAWQAAKRATAAMNRILAFASGSSCTTAILDILSLFWIPDTARVSCSRDGICSHILLYFIPHLKIALLAALHSML